MLKNSTTPSWSIRTINVCNCGVVSEEKVHACCIYMLTKNTTYKKSNPTDFWFSTLSFEMMWSRWIITRQTNNKIHHRCNLFSTDRNQTAMYTRFIYIYLKTKIQLAVTRLAKICEKKLQVKIQSTSNLNNILIHVPGSIGGSSPQSWKEEKKKDKNMKSAKRSYVWYHIRQVFFLHVDELSISHN